MSMSVKELAIIKYVWEKIEQNSGDINTEKIAEAFSISRKTVYAYIRKSIERGEIRYIKRGCYELILSADISEGVDIEKGKSDEMRIYEKWIEPYLQKLPKNVKSIWAYACSEMINNAIDHSDSKNVRISVEKDAWNTVVSISDYGIGIFKKIKEFFDYESEEEATHELFKGKLTTDSENHSGEGVFFTSRVMDRFVILSGGQIFSHNNFEDNYYKIKEWEEDKATTVIMQLSNFSEKRLVDIFDEFSDEDGRFLRINLIVKKFFANNDPISRSQAKRFVRRFEEYEEVLLDFRDVESIGQGFAHELFVIFNQKHPQITIDAINQNEGIKKMIIHVLRN